MKNSIAAPKEILSHRTTINKEARPEMNDFQKFLFFQQKAKEHDTLSKEWLMLILNNVSSATIRKSLHVSVSRWGKYLDGEEPMPDGFLKKFQDRFKTELANIRHKESIKRIEWYCREVRSTRETRKVSAKHSEKNVITSPRKAAK